MAIANWGFGAHRNRLYDTTSAIPKTQEQFGTQALTSWPSSTVAYTPSPTPGEEVAKAGTTFGGTSKLFGDPLVQSSLQGKRAQQKALTGQDYSPQQLQGIAAGEVGAYLQKQLAAREYALKEYQLKEQGKQFGATLGQRQAEFGFEQEKFGKELGLKEKTLAQQESQFTRDLDFRINTGEENRKLTREELSEKRYEFEKLYNFDYDKFQEMKEEFRLKYELDKETLQLSKDKLDQQDWQGIANLALNSPLLYAQMAKELWGSKNPWKDLKSGASWVYDKLFGDGTDPEAIIQNPDGTWSVPGFSDADAGLNLADTSSDAVSGLSEDLGSTGLGTLSTATTAYGGYNALTAPAAAAPALTAPAAAATTEAMAGLYGADALYGIGGAGSATSTGIGTTGAVVGAGTTAGIAAGVLAPLAIIGYGLSQKGTARGSNPFTNNTGSGVSGPAFAAANGTGITTGVNDSEMYQFLQSNLPTADVFAQRFQAQTGRSVPTGATMSNDQASYYQEWMDKQPEVRAARDAWNKYVDENYMRIDNPGSEGGSQGQWVNRNQYMTATFGY